MGFGRKKDFKPYKTALCTKIKLTTEKKTIKNQNLLLFSIIHHFFNINHSCPAAAGTCTY